MWIGRTRRQGFPVLILIFLTFLSCESNRWKAWDETGVARPICNFCKQFSYDWYKERAEGRQAFIKWVDEQHSYARKIKSDIVGCDTYFDELLMYHDSSETLRWKREKIFTYVDSIVDDLKKQDMMRKVYYDCLALCWDGKLTEKNSQKLIGRAKTILIGEMGSFRCLHATQTARRLNQGITSARLPTFSCRAVSRNLLNFRKQAGSKSPAIQALLPAFSPLKKGEYE